MSDRNGRDKGRRRGGDDADARRPGPTGDRDDDVTAAVPPASASEPSDLAEMIRDSELIDALSGSGAVATESAEEFEVATLISQWREEILSPPMPAGPDLDAIEAAVLTEIRTTRLADRRSPRRLTSVVAAAASVTALLGGLTVLAHQSKPGDTLWGVNETLFGDQARQVAAVTDIQSDLDKAAKLISTGDVPQGLALLNNASTRMTDVNKGSTYDDLNRRRAQLWSQATGKPAAAAPLPGVTVPTAVPAPVLPTAIPTIPKIPLPTGIPGIPGLPGLLTPPTEVPSPLVVPVVPTHVPTAPELPTLQLPSVPVPTVPTEPPVTVPTLPALPTVVPTQPAKPTVSLPPVPTIVPEPPITVKPPASITIPAPKVEPVPAPTGG
ncbi:hypothetical protein G4X40_02065 [Rhodococcus sp. D2-41]|uniref:Anti-sigma-D factor RsdA n=1 Tax=Speluncibacter jeojiensis TaxID=2710754 RepID=A0A9X4RIX4_9ACTN|nr:anti-sigma-D factor RsdA [Rhodococcus sp. D2-41]MDG3008929.1 hypothetical protein [Rhodococcus sp. D2-41]MDG3016551.1 anti-sigma-D factor RsdA [Corynebacteriales bacterium D3-21]